MLVIRVLVKSDVDCSFPLILFDLDIVSWCECIDIYNGSMSKDLVIDQRREFLHIERKNE